MVPLLLHFTYTSLAFGFMSLGETVIYCGPEGFLMWEISCVASMSLMFFWLKFKEIKSFVSFKKQNLHYYQLKRKEKEIV